MRVTALATGLADAAEALREHGASLVVLPGLGVLYATVGDDLPGLFARAVQIARAAGGSARIERAPAADKAKCDVFGDLGGALQLQRALKQRFDPAGVLNPGRTAGWL